MAKSEVAEIEFTIVPSNTLTRRSRIFKTSRFEKILEAIPKLAAGKSLVIDVPKGMEPKEYRSNLTTNLGALSKRRLGLALSLFLTDDNKVEIVPRGKVDENGKLIEGQEAPAAPSASGFNAAKTKGKR